MAVHGALLLLTGSSSRRQTIHTTAGTNALADAKHGVLRRPPP